jgi:glycerate dehydrogenase
MHIVITDGFTLNPGDLNWEPFMEIGQVSYYDRSDAAETIERCKTAEIIMTNKTPVTREVIEAAPNLRMIAVTATGYNDIDINAAKEHGVVVSNVPEYGTYSVAQHTFALLLELTNQVGIHAQSVEKGEWAACADWTYVKTPIIELYDKVIGLIGFGKIAQQTAQLAEAFGMKVIYFKRSGNDGDERLVDLEELLLKSDVVSLHCPLNDESMGMVNASFLNKMKPGAFLINTSRGKLINEADLADALQNKDIAGAALDVLSAEPPPADHPLVGLKNCIITPHNAWISFEARSRLIQTTLENIKQLRAGKPQNVVNP